MRQLWPPTRETQLRLARFAIVGGGSAAVQFGLLAWFKSWMNATLAFSVSWVISAAMHYFANRFWALPSARHDTAQQLGEYLFTVVVSYVINVAAFRFFYDVAGLSVLWAAFWAIPPSTAVTFLVLNYRVFRAKPRSG